MILKYIAIRLTPLLFLFALGYSFFLPSAGERQFTRTEDALARAQSYRMEKIFHGPEYDESWQLEVVCPDREHSLQSSRSNGSQWDAPPGLDIEDIDIGKQGYRRIAPAGTLDSTEWKKVLGPRGTYCGRAPFLQSSPVVEFKVIRALGHIEKKGLDTVNGETCQEWVVSVTQPNGVQKVFDFCINSQDDLPRRLKVGGSSFQLIFTDWDKPIDIQPPEWSQ